MIANPFLVLRLEYKMPPKLKRFNLTSLLAKAGRTKKVPANLKNWCDVAENNAPTAAYKR
jgi:hypothetical protein